MTRLLVGFTGARKRRAPASYAHPQTVDDIIDGIVGRTLLRLESVAEFEVGGLVGDARPLFSPWQAGRVHTTGAQRSQPPAI
jgi:hypothetical protein